MFRCQVGPSVPLRFSKLLRSSGAGHRGARAKEVVQRPALGHGKLRELSGSRLGSQALDEGLLWFGSVSMAIQSLLACDLKS
jgi:hypothetical protein